MLASLCTSRWIFYRDSAMLSRINQLDGKRMAIGVQEAARGRLPNKCSPPTA
jgi:hypothetical protein